MLQSQLCQLGFSALAALTSAFWNSDTRAIFATTKTTFSNVSEFSQLFKSNPVKLWPTVRLPSILLLEELQTPAAWDTFLNKLTLPPTQHTVQLPAPHTAQPLVPAHSLNQPPRATALCQSGAHPRGPSTSSLVGALPCRAIQHGFQHRAGASIVEHLLGHSHLQDTDTVNYPSISVGDLISRLYDSIMVRRLVKYTEQ